MGSISSVTIDAGVLAVPDISCTSDDAYKYIDTLLDWSKLLEESWIAIYMSERTSEVLFEDNLYPLRDHLKEIFNAHGIVEYDVNTVATIADKLLTNTPYFETFYGLKDVLSEHLETNPDVLRETKFYGLQSDLERCIILIAILRKHCFQPFGGHSIILRESTNQIVTVRAQVHDIEHERDVILSIPYFPDFFEGDILVCGDFNGFIECLDETSILKGASDKLGIALSIRIALFKHNYALGESIDWCNLIVPNIGFDFIKTCQKCCADQGDSLPPKILRSIIETVKKTNLSDVHALRTGPGGGDPQKVRPADKAKAQRRDIDKEFHLHYWECDDGKIELSSVVYHNDFSIS